MTGDEGVVTVGHISTATLSNGWTISAARAADESVMYIYLADAEHQPLERDAFIAALAEAIGEDRAATRTLVGFAEEEAVRNLEWQEAGSPE